jgi:hypothetical protein
MVSKRLSISYQLRAARRSPIAPSLISFLHVLSCEHTTPSNLKLAFHKPLGPMRNYLESVGVDKLGIIFF